MQNEHKVTRLQWQAIKVNYSYLLDEMAPDELVPHLVARRLLTPEQAKEVMAKSDRLQKITKILQALRLKFSLLWECFPHSVQPFSIQGNLMLQNGFQKVNCVV